MHMMTNISALVCAPGNVSAFDHIFSLEFRLSFEGSGKLMLINYAYYTFSI